MARHQAEKFLWLVAGLGLGAGCTYLFATNEGRKMRRKVVRMAEEGTERVKETGHEALERGKEMYERGRELVDEAMEFVDRGRRAVMR